MTASVRYLDAEPNGLAAMIGGLIEGNLTQHPERERLLKPAIIAIAAPDADVSLTICLRPGKVIVANGVRAKPELFVRAPSETLIELSSVPLRFGLPDSMTREGREVNRKLLRGEIKVKGMWVHLGKLSRLNKLLSVT
jgi:hypothetical protein